MIVGEDLSKMLNENLIIRLIKMSNVLSNFMKNDN